MNPEPFIVAAYAVAVGSLAALVWASRAAMRRAERAAERGAAVKPKRQRLVLLGVAGVALTGATALGLSAIGETATYFYSPSDFAARPPEAGVTFRLGGLVEPGSIARGGETVRFAVTDNARTLPVAYRGLTPDLFKEGSGVIATGRMGPDGVFRADELLAKHDENYMPPEVADSLHKTETAAE